MPFIYFCFVGVIIRQSFKSSVYTYVGTIVGAASLLYFFPRFFTPEELGAFRLMVEVGALLAGFGLLGIGQSITRFFPHFVDENGSVNGFLFLALSIPVIGSIIVSMVYILNKDVLLSFFDVDTELIGIIYLPVLFIALFRIYQTVFENISANYRRIAANNFIREIVTRLLLLLLSFFFFLGWYPFDVFCFYASLVFGINALLNFIVLATQVRLDFRPDFGFLRSNPKLRSDMLKYNLWLFGSSLAVLIVNKIDFLMISTEKGLQDTAIYSIAFYIAILIEIPKRGVLQIAAPIVSKHMKDKNISELDTLYKKASLAIFSVCTVLFFLIGFNLPLIMSFIPKGEIYQQGTWVVLIIGLGKVIEVIGLLAYPIISNSNYYTYGFISSVVNIFIAIVFNYILIPLYGINGAAIATFLTFVVSMMIQTVIVFKKIGIQPFTKEHVKTILVALFSLGLIIIFKMKEFDLIGLILGNVLMYAIYVAWYYKSAYKTEVKNLVLNAFKRS